LKRLEVTVSLDESGVIENIFSRLELKYLNFRVETKERDLVTYFSLVPDEYIDEVIGDITDRIKLSDEKILNILNVEAYVSRYMDIIQEKAAKTTVKPSPLEKLVEETERYTHINKNTILLTSFTTLITLSGLFLDNTVMLIGAMLLSPLLGPINAFAVNASLGRVRQTVRSQMVIISLALVVVTISTILPWIASNFVPLKITTLILSSGRTRIIDIGIAVILGLAGGLALYIAIPESLIGVAVAVALVPPAAVTGIGIAFQDINLFLGALILTLANILGLQLGGTILLSLHGIAPRNYFRKEDVRNRRIYAILIMTGMLIMFVYLVLVYTVS
jgi:uncharacterized hydrophobic protein (TIGR00341 family)